MEGGPEGAAGGLGRQVGGQGRDRLGVVARIVRKLDSDRLCGALGNSSVQFLNGSLSLNPLVESNKANAL